jgi:hypothetical protein
LSRRIRSSAFTHLTLGSLVLGLALLARPAAAEVTKDQCVDANANAQALRLDGKLAAARAELQICNDPICPSIVQADCTQRLDELEKVQPTIVFDVKGPTGSDIGAVVTIDARPIAAAQGSAIRVDPGSHTFTFTAPGEAPVTQTFVIKEGEKGRRERIQIGTPPTAPAPAPPPVAPAPPAAGLGSQKILGLGAGGLGVVGLAVGSVFGVLTLSAVSQQKTDCASASSCASHSAALSDHSSASTDAAISTTAFIAGGALLAGGAALFFMARAPRETGTAAGVTVAPSLAPGSGGLLVRGTF